MDNKKNKTSKEYEVEGPDQFDEIDIDCEDHNMISLTEDDVKMLMKMFEKKEEKKKSTKYKMISND